MDSVKEERKASGGARRLRKGRARAAGRHWCIHWAQLFSAQGAGGYWKGVAASRSFPGGVDPSASPSLLSLRLFFSNSVFSLNRHFACWEAPDRIRRHQHTHTQHVTLLYTGSPSLPPSIRLSLPPCGSVSPFRESGGQTSSRSHP